MEAFEGSASCARILTTRRVRLVLSVWMKLNMYARVRFDNRRRWRRRRQRGWGWRCRRRYNRIMHAALVLVVVCVCVDIGTAAILVVFCQCVPPRYSHYTITRVCIEDHTAKGIAPTNRPTDRPSIRGKTKEKRKNKCKQERHLVRLMISVDDYYCSRLHMCLRCYLIILFNALCIGQVAKPFGNISQKSIRWSPIENL